MSESRDTSQSIDEICERHNGKPGALLPILHDVQGQYGFIPRHSVAEIATNLNLTRAEVDGVVSFYSDFKTSLPARRVIKICRAEACQASGGRDIWNAAVVAAAASGGSVEVEAVYCLGNCACGPSAQIDDRTLGRLDEERIVALIAAPGREGDA